MPLRLCSAALGGLIVGLFSGSCHLLALDPSKALTQYTRGVWTQAQGLPQDTVRAIAQTQDGYLWLGTSEGLARFDGYDFVTFTKDDGSLPSNSITTLSAGRSGSLWIGTSSGLARYSDGQFRTFTAKDGVPPGAVTAVVEDHAGVLWFVSGDFLSRFENGNFTTYPKESLAPVEAARVVYEDREDQLWVGGSKGVVKLTGDKFSTVLTAADLGGNVITSIVEGARGTWIAGIDGIILVRPGGKLTRFSTRDGLPNNFIQALCADRAGNLWVGTYGGLSRLENDRFVSARANQDDRDWVWSLFEDREGDLWVGMNSALIRLRDDRFSMYGSSEGLPSDEPVAVHQDRRGGIWVGYHVGGLVAFRPGKFRIYTTRDGLPSNEIFSIRDGGDGELLIGTYGGLSRMSAGHFINYTVPDPVGRTSVYDAIEDARGHVWAATPSGVYEYDGVQWHHVVRGRSSTSDFVVTLAKGREGSLWAGTLDNGLWEVVNPNAPNDKPRLFTTADALLGNQIRSLYQDFDGSLWIGSFGSGLIRFRDGVFTRYAARDGLLSDNISHVEDDEMGSLWLSTTRGICRISKKQLEDFSAGRIRVLTPQNYGTADGLRSAQCAPSFPAGGGGTRTSDGRLWFPTTRGLAAIDPNAAGPDAPEGASTPIAHIVEISVDGHAVAASRAARLEPGVAQVQFRYAGIYLSAPDRVRYSYKLEGLDHDWISAGSRRTIDYNPLPHGRYRFAVRAALPGGAASETQFAFEVLPHFFETQWFLGLCAISLAGAVYGIYRLRLMRIHSRFALVCKERARLAREIHDTLAQGFVGISHQLDALAIQIDGDPDVARQQLNLARKMARHSLTEARRSVMDLRAPELEEQDLPTALAASARLWVAGSPANVRVEVSGVKQDLPADLEQNLLRIAQEAVANAVKHANARMIWVDLESKGRFLQLRVKDDGQGFEPSGTFSAIGGHFGILGMRERAERLGGKFALASCPGSGTQVEVTVPLASRNTRIG